MSRTTLGKRMQCKQLCTLSRVSNCFKFRIIIIIDDPNHGGTPTKQRKGVGPATPGKEKRTPVRRVSQQQLLNSSLSKSLCHDIITLSCKRGDIILMFNRWWWSAHLHSILHLTSSMKKIAKSFGWRNSKSVARQAMNHRRIGECVLHILANIWNPSAAPRHLRCSESIQFKPWNHLAGKMNWKEPHQSFSPVLKECVFRKRRKASKRGRSYAVNDSAIVGMCAAILLRHQNANMNRIVSALL